MISVAVFAYNEQRNIRRALDSIFAAAPADGELQIYVLINGCTDRTAEIVREYSAERPEVVPVEIPFGDKSNAWNVYVHELSGKAAQVHFFMDGDCWCSPGSLTAMSEALLANSNASAIAGVPQSGRNRRTLIRYVKEKHWVLGNLYAVKASRIEWIRERGIRLPVGLIGDDHVVTRLLWLDESGSNCFRREQVIFREGYGPCWNPLSPFSLQDFRIYFRRMVTYALRQMQLKRLGMNPLPNLEQTIDAINREILDELNAKHLWHPIDRAVRRRLRWMYPLPNSTFHSNRIAACGTPVVVGLKTDS